MSAPPTTVKELKTFLGQPETLKLEFKSSEILMDRTGARNPQLVAKLSRQISAFANTEGGLILIGLEEDPRGGQPIAKALDHGTPASVISPPQLQQMLVDGLRPPVPGLRIHPIIRDKTKHTYAYAIEVPPSTTAHQASDYLYYGRYEYEVRPLTDQEIRLRMFRRQQQSAVIEAVNATLANRRATLGELQNASDPTLKLFAKQQTDPLGPRFPWVHDHLAFDLAIKNTGLLSIHSFALVIGPMADALYVDQIWVCRDGRPARLRGISDIGWGPLHVAIFPSLGWQLPEPKVNPQRISYYRMDAVNQWIPSEALHWRLFLDDRAPIEGAIAIPDLARQAQRLPPES